MNGSAADPDANNQANHANNVDKYAWQLATHPMKGTAPTHIQDQVYRTSPLVLPSTKTILEATGAVDSSTHKEVKKEFRNHSLGLASPRNMNDLKPVEQGSLIGSLPLKDTSSTHIEDQVYRTSPLVLPSSKTILDTPSAVDTSTHQEVKHQFRNHCIKLASPRNINDLKPGEGAPVFQPKR